MAQLKGLKKLQEAIDHLKEVAQEVQLNLEEKRSYCESLSDKWQETEKADEWYEHLDDVEELLDNINDLDVPTEQ